MSLIQTYAAPLPTVGSILNDAIDCEETSRKWLAAIAGCSVDTVGTWLKAEDEPGHSEPKFRYLVAMLKAKRIPLHRRQAILELLTRDSGFQVAYEGVEDERELDRDQNGAIDEHDAVAYGCDAINNTSEQVCSLNDDLANHRLPSEEKVTATLASLTRTERAIRMMKKVITYRGPRMSKKAS